MFLVAIRRSVYQSTAGLEHRNDLMLLPEIDFPHIDVKDFSGISFYELRDRSTLINPDLLDDRDCLLRYPRHKSIAVIV